MTDDCYRAKMWLSRTINLMNKVKAEERTLLVLQNKIGSGVRSYDNSGGAHDIDSSLHRHETLLLEYSLQCERIEKAQNRYLYEMKRTQNVIDQLSKPIYQALATDRYINNLKWKDIEDNYFYGRSELFILHNQLLEEVSHILTPAIIEPEDFIEENIGA